MILTCHPREGARRIVNDGKIDRARGLRNRADSDVCDIASSVEPRVSAPIDANGNLTSDGTKTYYWNALNELIEVKEASTTIATFEYDGDGRRTEKVAGIRWPF